KDYDPGSYPDAWTCYRVGEAYFLIQDYVKALEWYKQARSLMPRALDFQAKYGNCLLALGRWEEAQQVFEYLIAQQPGIQIPYANLGFIYMQKGEVIRAIDWLEKALQRDPDHQQTLLNLAVCHFQIHQPAKSREYLLRVIKKDPAHQQARAMLADLEGGG